MTSSLLVLDVYGSDPNSKFLQCLHLRAIKFDGDIILLETQTNNNNFGHTKAENAYSANVRVTKNFKHF